MHSQHISSRLTTPKSVWYSSAFRVLESPVGSLGFDEVGSISPPSRPPVLWELRPQLGSNRMFRDVLLRCVVTLIDLRFPFVTEHQYKSVFFYFFSLF